MRKPLLAFFIATIIISLLVNIFAYGQPTGYYGYMNVGGTAQSGATNTFCLNFTANFPTGYCGRIKEVYVYGAAQGGGSYWIQSAIYTSTMARVGISERSTVSNNATLDWRSLTFDNCYLLSGDYFMAVANSNGSFVFRYDRVTGNIGKYYTSNDLPVVLSSPVDWENKTMSAYLVYDYIPISEYDTPLTEAGLQTNWGTFIFLLVLSLVCIALAWKSNIPIINFVFGTVTLGAAAYYLGSNIVLAGWINILAILMASLCMLTGGMKLRGG